MCGRLRRELGAACRPLAMGCLTKLIIYASPRPFGWRSRWLLVLRLVTRRLPSAVPRLKVRSEKCGDRPPDPNSPPQ